MGPSWFGVLANNSERPCVVAHATFRTGAVVCGGNNGVSLRAAATQTFGPEYVAR